MVGDNAEAQERRRQWRKRIITLQSKTREELIEHARTDTPTWPEAELGSWADAKLRFNMNALNRQGANDVDWPQILRNITCPALLLYADQELGGGVTPERAAEMQELVPQLQVVHIAFGSSIIREYRLSEAMDETAMEG